MPSPVSPRQLTYPEPPRSDIIDELHGVKVADPFRPLEDVDSEATRAWVDAQEKLTSSWLAEQPQREVILERLQSVWNHERFGVPVRRGGRYFYQHNPGLLDQSALYWLEHLDDEPRLLLDPNQLASDGTSALVSWAPSRDGRHLVYGISNAGSDWREWRVRDVATGRDLDDVVRWSKFCEAVWAHDGSGFYYSVYPASVDDNVQATDQLLGQRLMFHRLGSAQSDDEVVYERPEHPTWGYLPVVSDDGRFLVVSIWRGSARVNQVLVRRLDGNDPLAAPFVELMMGFDARYTFIANVENSLLFQTDRDAPRGSVVAVTLDHPDSSAWSIVLPEADDVLESASLVGGNLVACYLRDAASAVRVFTRDGEHRHDLELDDLATAVGFGGTPDDPETFFAMTSFTRPTTIYRYDAASGQHEVWRAPRVDFDPAQFRTRQVFYTSRDGTRVPMFLAHRIDLADGPHPTILYGYGGFDVSLTPAFSPAALAWMEMGGVYAVPNLRGGGEYGAAWHAAGMREKKQNVFDDFICAAEHLVAEGLTDRPRLAITGGSNGGLLVGACLTQRPELFGAACPSAAVLDMLRYHRFTIGWAWPNTATPISATTSRSCTATHPCIGFAPAWRIRRR